ncbi:hypothetical protein [Deinococcus cellulosilyticus]|uniref:Uncharacterized protein n=1 Tax=Deinococcus cellulosilyticus (strain DSM 18568 / NBRC 106333 / KACC 11606 / 5516J-15) TaxID=1223518 RepID=A0A511N525_DEIC1|nr:hypothetical protein [Deinococcus cellulosilyticus]GEM47577.1 hypothetical protein DC3_32120 [Deinococcus cellulosilyticus NBRC 106333 = KACC 11606]
MNPIPVPHIQQPRCFMVYALAPAGVSAREANEKVNLYVEDPKRGMALYHDHFIGTRGGMVIFFVENEEQRQALTDPGPLEGWSLTVHPLIYSRSPGGFDAQIAFTLKAYRDLNWEEVQLEKRPQYGNASEEASTGVESCSIN